MARWQLTEPEFFWLCGLLEGEASFDYNYKSQRVRLEMTDEDTIYRAAALLNRLGNCNVNVCFRDNVSKPNWKDSYYIQLYGEPARIVMKAVVSFMSYRRRQQIWRSLNCRSQKEFVAPSNVVNLENLMKEIKHG